MAKKAKEMQADQNTATSVLGDEPQVEKKKRGGAVKAFYIDVDGKETTSMPDEPRGVVARVGDDGQGNFGSIGERTIYFKDLPAATQFRHMAFGLRTAMQNAVNTAESPMDGWEALERRADNWLRDVWAETGSGGGGTPLYLQAFALAARTAGHSEEVISTKLEAFLAIYNDETGGEKEQEKRRKELRKSLMAKPSIEKAFYQLQAEAIEKRKAALANKPAGDDLGDLL